MWKVNLKSKWKSSKFMSCIKTNLYEFIRGFTPDVDNQFSCQMWNGISITSNLPCVYFFQFSSPCDTHRRAPTSQNNLVKSQNKLIDKTIWPNLAFDFLFWIPFCGEPFNDCWCCRWRRIELEVSCLSCPGKRPSSEINLRDCKGSEHNEIIKSHNPHLFHSQHQQQAELGNEH